MRVTENQTATRFLDNINRTRERVSTLQAQLASGKRVLKPSDDPRATDAILRMQAQIEANDQFTRSNVDAQAMLETTSESLSNTSDVLLQIKELLVRANNSANLETLPTYATNIDSLLTALVDISNTKFNGKYIFAGTNTLERPFEMNPGRTAVIPNPNGVDGVIEYPVGEGITQTANIPGDVAFQGTAIFDTLIRLRDTMAAGTLPTAADMTAVGDHLDHVLNQASNAGTSIQTLMTNETFLASRKTQLQSLLSLQQDSDVAEAVTELKRNEVMLEAALNTTSRIIPKSLLDFLP